MRRPPRYTLDRSSAASYVNKRQDFYAGLIYQAMGFPVDMFPVLCAIPRTSGGLAQWCEMLDDSEQKIARPRQIYTGKDRRDYPEGRANPFEYERKRS